MSTTIPPNNNTGLYNTQSSTTPTVDGNIAANNIVASGNVTVGGYVSAVGNISGNYILGNGSLLTGLPETYANANVASFLASGTDGSNIITTANISGSYILGNGSQLTGLPESYSNANVAAYLPVYNGNIGANVVTANLFSGSGANLTSLTGANVTGTVANATYALNAGVASLANTATTATTANTANSATTAGTVTGNAQANITSVGTLTSLSVSGNIDGGNLNTGGNVTGLFLKTSGIQGNIVGPNYVSANYFVGDGSLLTNLPGASYGNANVADYLPTYTGNVGYGNLVLANAGAANSVIQRNTFNSNTGVEVSTTTSNPDIYTKVGVGSNYLNLQQSNNGNANVILQGGYGVTIEAQSTPSSPSYAWSFVGSGNTLTPGNIQIPNTAGIYYANGAQYGGGSSYGNANVDAHLADFGSNTISTTGNITAGYFAGNGSLLTNLTGANISGTVANATYAVDAGHAVVSDSANAVSGSNVSGAVALATQANTANVANSVSGSNVSGAVALATQANYANIANSVSGSNVSGTVADASHATVADSANAVAGANVTGTVALATQSNYANIANSVSGSNVSGQVANALVAGTVYTAAQPAITSVGTLTSLSVSGNVTGGNLLINNNANITNDLTVGGTIYGTFAGNISGNLVVPGANTQVIYNNNGNAGASANFTFDSATNQMSVTGNVVGGNISTVGNITGAYISGNGSLLSSITGANITGTVANATYATSAGSAATASDATHATVADSANAVAGGNVTGQVANALVAGTVYTNAQPNITSVGTLSSLSVTGNVAGGNVSVTGVVYTPQIESSTSLDLNSPSDINANGNLRVGDNNTNTQIATHGAADLLITTHAGDASQGNIRLYDGASGNIDVTTNGTGTINLNSVVRTTGNIVTSGILTDGYYYANGAPFTGGGGSTYGDSNVNTLLSAWGSNSLSTTGNVTVSNLVTSNILMTGQISNPVGDNIAIENITTGLISATGNITGAYLLGNISGATGGYGNANVATFLNDFGSNSIITTGNIGNVASKVGTGFFNAVATDNISSPSGDFVTIENVSTTAINATGNISATGTVTAGAVTYANTDGTVGQVLTTYGNGVTYFSTVSGGGGSPGGSDSQIQYNNGGSFGGNVAMTFDDTTGNIGLGNIVVNTNQIQTVSVANLAATTASGQTTPWRVLLGNAYNGNTNSAYSSTSSGTITSPLNAPRLLVADFVTVPNNGMRFQEHTNYVWANLSANISNTSTRLASQRNEITVGGGTSGYTITATNTPSMILATSNQINLGGGTNANLSLIGNLTTTAGAMGSFNGVTVNNYSTANIIVGQQTNLVTNNANTTAFGNATTQLGHVINFGGAPANANITGTTTTVAYYMPGATAVIPGFTATNGNIARQAANYYSFRSDDTLAKAQLGSLSSFNEYTANTTSSSGTLTVNKSNGQVQQVYPTENITTVAFSGFVTRVQKPDATYVNQSDTVTLIIVQGATPYTVTMPSGTGYKYAGGANTVGATANTTTMISITGTYNYNIAANEYLITISPEFV